MTTKTAIRDLSAGATIQRVKTGNTWYVTAGNKNLATDVRPVEVASVEPVRTQAAGQTARGARHYIVTLTDGTTVHFSAQAKVEVMA